MVALSESQREIVDGLYKIKVPIDAEMFSGVSTEEAVEDTTPESIYASGVGTSTKTSSLHVETSELYGKLIGTDLLVKYTDLTTKPVAVTVGPLDLRGFSDPHKEKILENIIKKHVHTLYDSPLSITLIRPTSFVEDFINFFTRETSDQFFVKASHSDAVTIRQEEGFFKKFSKAIKALFKPESEISHDVQNNFVERPHLVTMERDDPENILPSIVVDEDSNVSSDSRSHFTQSGKNSNQPEFKPPRSAQDMKNEIVNIRRGSNSGNNEDQDLDNHRPTY